MFITVLKARMRVLLREKNFVFWGLVFPIFLATFLYIETTTESIGDPILGSHKVVMSEGITLTRTYLDQDGKLDGIVFFLGILAVACFLSGFSGLREMEDCLCYISPKAVRVNIAPISFKLFFSCSFLATWFISNMYFAIACIYFIAILGISLQGPLVGWMLLISLSTLCCNLVAMFIGAFSKLPIPIKQAEIATIGVGGCILAGLINEEIKFYVDAYYPIISKVNPTSIIVDGMLTLCTEGMNPFFYVCLLRLSIFNGICFILLLLVIRRRRRL